MKELVMDMKKIDEHYDDDNEKSELCDDPTDNPKKTYKTFKSVTTVETFDITDTL